MAFISFDSTISPLIRVFREKNRPESTINQESETETIYSFPPEEDLLRETQIELQRLQLENIELKSKYKAVKTDSQSRIEQLESEIEKYKLDLCTEARNSQLLKIENIRLATGDSRSLASKEKKYQKDFEKETKLVRQYNRLVKC